MVKQRALYEALLRLKNDKSFESVIDWLKELREETRTQLETQTDRFHVEQGKAQMLKKILDSIETAPQVLEKIAK